MKIKTLIITVLISSVMNQAIASPAIDSRLQLRSATGSAKVAASSLLQAIEERSRPKIRTSLQALIAGGSVDLALTVLFDPLDDVKQEAALSVAHVKTKRVGQALLAAYNNLAEDAYGGTEAQGLRDDTRKVFEITLQEVTAAQINKTQTMSQKVKIFTDATAAMQN